MATFTWSALYLGTIADIDTDEGVLGAENPNALIRTWGSAADPLFKHDAALTATSDEPDNLEVDSNQVGAPDTISYDIGGGPVTTQVDTGAAVTALVTFHDGTTYNSSFAVIQDQTGKVFLLIADTDATLASKAIDTFQVTGVTKTDYGGLFLDTRDDLSFVCFASGGRIATPSGPRLVEALREGDMVLTDDAGPRPIRWIARRSLWLPRGESRDRPVRVAAGALGPGLPERDVDLSPRHRVLLRLAPWAAAAMEARGKGGRKAQPEGGGEPLEVLSAVGFLCGAPGIAPRRGVRTVDYHALMLDGHHLLRAEGMGAESFHPGPYARRTLPQADLARLLAVRPELAAPEATPGPLARRDLKRREAAALVRAAQRRGGLGALAEPEEDAPPAAGRRVA
ncbi:Hint domain-containing protein [Rhodovulum sp. DZ06]|uniref:Hint domain-containing protein n=1 Tax=Rhodovulum sp. DZ06 TaxID=3425126 RepID=UPI003D32A6EE